MRVTVHLGADRKRLRVRRIDLDPGDQGEGVGASRDLDDMGSVQRIGLLDGGAQGAGPGHRQTGAVTGRGVRQVRGARHGEVG